MQRLLWPNKWGDATLCKGSREINSVHRLQGSGTVTWFLRYQRTSQGKRELCRRMFLKRCRCTWHPGLVGLEAKTDEEGRWGDKKIWPRPLCGRAGSSKKEGGSSYKVVRPALMVNKATTAGPLPAHNNNHSRSAFNKFQQFPGIFFRAHHFASVPASQRSMTVKYRSFQPLSGQTPISVFLHFLSPFSRQRGFIFTSLSSSGNTWSGCFDAWRRCSHWRHTSSGQQCNLIRLQKICAADICSNSISAHMFHTVLQTPPQRQRSRMQRFGFTSSGSKGKYSEHKYLNGAAAAVLWTSGKRFILPNTAAHENTVHVMLWYASYEMSL